MSDYNLIERVLHHVALTSPAILEVTFDMELALARATSGDAGRQEHVFVSGLARGGTTILMRSLYESGQFTSLTYADMPFVLAPNLWRKISRGRQRKQMQAKERAHGDGILVDYNSPEALDEVFWRAFTHREYIREDCLVPYECSDEVVDKFRKYIADILTCEKEKRYLSKNNNNVLRIGSILRAFPEARILIPFREPLQHANSLLKQHVLFAKRQAEDAFVRNYMSWLGHHEFGKTHKPVIAAGSLTRHSSLDKIDYWLQQWCNVYQFLLSVTDRYPENIRYVSYELMCNETDAVWSSLCRFLEITGTQVPVMRQMVRETPVPSDNQLLDEANALFVRLTEKSREQFFGS